MGDTRLSLSGKTGNDYYHVAVPLILLREDDASRKLLLDAERRFPDFPRIHIMLASLDLYQGRTNEAAGRMEALRIRAPDDEEVKFLRADVAFLTDSSDLQPALEALMKTAASNSVSVPESVRLRYAYVLRKKGRYRTGGGAARGSGAASRAGRLKKRINRRRSGSSWRPPRCWAGIHPRRSIGCRSAYDAGFRDYGSLELDPIFAALRSDNRFRAILERMRKEVDAQRARARDRGLLDFDSLLAPPSR